MMKRFTIMLASSFILAANIPLVAQAQSRPIQCFRGGIDAAGRRVFLPCRFENRTPQGVQRERNCRIAFNTILVNGFNPLARRFAVEAYLATCTR
jgi:hypothetical protein